MNFELKQRILEKLSLNRDKAPDSSGNYWANCPYHHDHNPDNFSVNFDKNAFYCFSCQAKGNIEQLANHLGVAVLQTVAFSSATLNIKNNGNNMSKLQEKTKENSKNGQDSSSVALLRQNERDKEIDICSVENYAKYKQIPIDELRGLHVKDTHFPYPKGEPAIKLTYLTEDLQEARPRIRIALSGSDKFRWGGKKSLSIVPYGLWNLAEIKESNEVILVEGESDCHTFWHYDQLAIGIPGAATWKKEWSKYFETVENVYIWQEPDSAGKKFIETVGETLPNAKVIQSQQYKDISEAHILGENVPELIKKLKTESIPYAEIKEAEIKSRVKQLEVKASEFFNCPDILKDVINTANELGLVGESNNAKLVYLAVTSRLLNRPINLVLKGPSSAGKSFIVETILKLFPRSAYHDLSGMSERALVYDTEPLKHRILVIYETAGMNDQFGTYLLRSLLSENRVKYTTVEKVEDSMQARTIEREGPTGLITTTTWTSLHPENETRIFSITVSDSQEQTQAIFYALADRMNGHKNKPVDLEAWHAFQEWLELAGIKEVNIPFAKEIAEKAYSKAVRLRRDFSAVLNLIAVHAILHQKQREIDQNGRVIATLEDYQVIFDLVNAIVGAGVQATVSPITRETVKAVSDILAEKQEDINSENSVSIRELADKLQIDKASASRRWKVAASDGYLVNLEDRKGKPARLILGEPMPDEISILPKPDTLSVALPNATVMQQCNTFSILQALEEDF